MVCRSKHWLDSRHILGRRLPRHVGHQQDGNSGECNFYESSLTGNCDSLVIDERV